MANVFREFINGVWKSKPADSSVEVQASTLRKRTENVLMTDRFSDEVKDLVESGSGCGFVALLRVLRLLDSPIFLNREAQTEFLQSFKRNFGSLSADLGPGDLVRFCKENNLDIKVVDYYYNINLATAEDIRDELTSHGRVDLDFSVNVFRPDLFDLVLEPGQVAILGLEKKTDEGIQAHYLCSDSSDIITRVNPGGSADLKKYLSQGYKISDVLVYEREGTDQPLNGE